MADKQLATYNINVPPLVVDGDVAPAASNNVTHAWQTWREHLRHLILHSEAKIGLRKGSPKNAFIEVDPESKTAWVNTSRLHAWNPAERKDESRRQQYEDYGDILYAILYASNRNCFQNAGLNDAVREIKKLFDVDDSYFTGFNIPAITSSLQKMQQEKVPKYETANLSAATKALDELHTRLADYAYTTVPALIPAYHKATVSESPRILTDVEQHGPVETLEINRLREMHNGWRKKHRALMQDRDIKFLMGNRWASLTESGDPLLVRVSTNDMHVAELFQSNQARGLRIKDTTIDYAVKGREIELRALIAAIGIGPETIDWNAARDEVVKNVSAEDKEYARARYNDPYFILNHAIYEIQYTGSLEKLEKKKPALAAVYKDYMAFVDQEYDKVKQRIAKEREAKYQARNTAFDINYEKDALTQAQQSYFEKLNQAVTLLGVTPKELDDQFRLEQRRQYLASNDIAGLLLISSSARDYQRSIKDSMSDDRQEYYEKYGAPITILKPYKEGILPDVTRGNPDDNQDLLNGIPQLDESFGLVKFDLSADASKQDENLHG